MSLYTLQDPTSSPDSTPRHVTARLGGGNVHRAAVQGVDLNNLVGYKRVRSPEVFEYLDFQLNDFG